MGTGPRAEALSESDFGRTCRSFGLTPESAARWSRKVDGRLVVALYESNEQVAVVSATNGSDSPPPRYGVKSPDELGNLLADLVE